jgi:alpha-glucuronidase
MTATAAEAAVSVVVANAKQHDAGVALAIGDLTAALKAASPEVSVAYVVVYRKPDAPLPEGDVILVGSAYQPSGKRWKPDRPEGFRIQPLELSGRRALTVEGDQRGLMYGVFKLAERIRLGEELWQIKIESAPAFPMRMYSEEGQLLDIPDVGYYSDEPPYVDEKRLQREVNELKQLVDHVAKLGFNTLTVLHLSFEEYIDYKYLDKEVYAPDDRHRLRSPVFCKYLRELCDYAHARHIDVYLQLYEIQYPSRLDELYGVDMDSPNMERIIAAKTRELFERVPLDGLVITITETHPRCGYASKNLWLKHEDTVEGFMGQALPSPCREDTHDVPQGLQGPR